MTSVAYAVTLLTVAAVTGLEFSTATKAEATTTLRPPVSTTGVLELRTVPPVRDIERARMLAQRATDAKVIKSAAVTTTSSLARYERAVEPLTGHELSNLLYNVGFTGKAHKLAWGIVMRESNARPKAHNNNPKTGDNSYGIFQINMIGSLGADRRAKYDLTDNVDLFNPVVSAQIAFKMSAGGTDFGAWGIGPNAYRSGAGESTLRLDGYPGVVTSSK